MRWNGGATAPGFALSFAMTNISDNTHLSHPRRTTFRTTPTGLLVEGRAPSDEATQDHPRPRDPRRASGPRRGGAGAAVAEEQRVRPRAGAENRRGILEGSEAINA